MSGYKFYKPFYLSLGRAISSGIKGNRFPTEDEDFHYICCLDYLGKFAVRRANEGKHLPSNIVTQIESVLCDMYSSTHKGTTVVLPDEESIRDVSCLNVSREDALSMVPVGVPFYIAVPACGQYQPVFLLKAPIELFLSAHIMCNSAMEKCSSTYQNGRKKVVVSTNMLRVNRREEYILFMSEYTEGKSYSEGKGYMTVSENSSYNKEDSPSMKLMLKVLASLELTPNRFIDGVPPGVVLHTEDRNRTLTMSSPGRSKAIEHHRGKHERRLYSERFYRGEYSHMSPGSRVIFVEACAVNRKSKEILTVGEKQ